MLLQEAKEKSQRSEQRAKELQDAIPGAERSLQVLLQRLHSASSSACTTTRHSNCLPGPYERFVGFYADTCACTILQQDAQTAAHDAAWPAAALAREIEALQQDIDTETRQQVFVALLRRGWPSLQDCILRVQIKLSAGCGSARCDSSPV